MNFFINNTVDVLQSHTIGCIDEPIIYAGLLNHDVEPISTNPILAFSCIMNNIVVEKKYLIAQKCQENACIFEIEGCLERIFNELKERVAEQALSLTIERMIE